jgi:3-hydroxybutyryl-CoA dehydrogenase
VEKEGKMDIKTVGVVGAGLMGAGIAEIAARSGYQVVVREVEQGVLQRALKNIERSMARGVERGKLTEEERAQAAASISGTVELDDLRDCDLVIEAIVENLELKQALFRELDRVTRPEAILTSNTSSISLTALAAATSRPDKVAGTHFFIPVPHMTLVELVRALQTSDQTLETMRRFCESLGKEVVVVKDTPAFVFNRLLIPYLLDAIRLIDDGVSTKEDIDRVMKLGTSVPIGPISLADYIGLDTVLYISEVMYEEFKKPGHAAPPLLRKMVAAGYLGRKSGRGFYDYGSKA